MSNNSMVLMIGMLHGLRSHINHTISALEEIDPQEWRYLGLTYDSTRETINALNARLDAVKPIIFRAPQESLTGADATAGDKSAQVEETVSSAPASPPRLEVVS